MTRVKAVLPVATMLVLVSVYLLIYYKIGYIQSKFMADWLALIGLSFMSASTFPVAMKALRNNLQSSTDKFLFSYWFIWTLVFWHRVWIISLAIMKASYPHMYDVWYYSPISGLIVLGLATSALFGGAAPLQSDLPLPRRELIIFTIAAGFSGIIAGIAIGIYYSAGWVN